MQNYINILKYAMDREKEGQKFFLDNAKRFTSPVSKALFEKLAAVEQEHYDFLKEQLDYTSSSIRLGSGETTRIFMFTAAVPQE